MAGHACGLNGARFAAFEGRATRTPTLNVISPKENVRHMLRSLSAMLESTALSSWLAAYPELDTNRPSKTMVMRRAISSSSSMDLLCVLLSGHRDDAESEQR